MGLPVLRSMRRPSLAKENFEGVVVDHLQVSLVPNRTASGDQFISPSALKFYFTKWSSRAAGGWKGKRTSWC